MIRLSVVIMAHPTRKAQVDHVLEQLGEEVPVVWDERNDRWDTGRRSMLAFDPDCTHHLVIQDDTLVCRDLIPGVKNALAHIPENAPLCLYMGKRLNPQHFLARVAKRAEAVQASFITMKTLNWGPGICVPTEAITEMIEYCYPLVDVLNYDKRLSRYWELSAGIRIWHTWPCLLDHADGPSLIPGRLGANRDDPRHARVAQCFLGEDRSALEVDWSGPVLHARGSIASGREIPPDRSLSVAIMAHPKRRPQVEALQGRLGVPSTVVWDIYDDRWDTGRRAMLSYDPGCTHHLVLQDDVVLSRHLIPGVVEMLTHVPKDIPVSLYLGKHKRIPEATAEADAVGASFISWSKLDHGLGVVVPTSAIRPMLDYCDTRTDIPNYDARLSSYWESRRKPTWYCQPSLIDHADGPSLVPGRRACDHGRSQRVARLFVGDDRSALSVRWTGPVVTVAEPEPEPPAAPSPFFRNADVLKAREQAATQPPKVAAPPAPRKTFAPLAEVRLSAAIMAHPSRTEQVARTLDRLDRPVPVTWDEHNDRWDTGRRSMLAYDPECTHHVVIQDDLIIPRDLLAGLERALTHVPANAPLCGYVGRVRPAQDRVRDLVAQAQKAGASFLTMTQLYWGPLIVVPTAAIRAMIDYCDPLTGIENYDLRLSRYWETEGVRVWYTWPCVVDHDDGPSLVPGRTGVNRTARPRSRVAHAFCGENASVLDLDWSGPVLRGR